MLPSKDSKKGNKLLCKACDKNPANPNIGLCFRCWRIIGKSTKDLWNIEHTEGQEGKS